MDLQAILAKSRQVMEKTKDLPYGGYTEQSGQAVNKKDGNVMFEQRVANESAAPVFSESAASKSKLPKEIIEAMRQSASDESSVTEGIKIKKQRNPYEVLNESKKTDSQGQGIDYELIRSMIDESVKKYVGSLKKTILSESKTNNGGLSMMTKKGNTFRFVTEDGKIFEADLKYRGNINE